MYAPTPGKLLRSRYRVLSPLGKGGFGQTFIAEDLDLPNHPRCVVKQLKPASSDRYFLENARRLFQSEAQSLMRLGTHDQIPRLLAYFEEGQEFYLVQELVEGHPLSDELPPGRRWAELDVCELLYEVLTILQFIHTQGVIHRDLKPDNLIRRYSDRKPVLVDFGTVKEIRTPGLTRRSRASSVATIAVGTPGYMPTEQGRGKPRPNSDIYALGIIGIQAVTGLNPDQFQEDSETGEIIWQPWAQVSDRLAEILTQMVRYYFRDRYQSTQHVLADLAPLLGKSSPVQESEEFREPTATVVSPPVGVPNPPAIETWVSPPVESEIASPNETEVIVPPKIQEPDSILSPVENKPSIKTSPAVSPIQEPEPIPSLVERDLAETHAIASPPIQQPELIPNLVEDISSTEPSTITSPLTQDPNPISSPSELLIETGLPDIQEPVETLVSTPAEDQPQASNLPQITKVDEALPHVSEPIAAAEPWIKTKRYVERITRTLPNLTVPQISRNILAIAGLSVASIAIVAISFLLKPPEPEPSPVISNPPPQQNPIDPDQETLNAAIEIARDGKISSLEEAVQKTKAIKSDSSVYAKAKEQVFKWQTKLLQDYLQSEAPKKYEKVRDLILPAKPEIKQIDETKVTISYNSTVNKKFNDDKTALLGFTAVLMELLRGNSKEKVATKYADFKQLTIHPEPGTLQATLSASDWDSYTKGAIDFDGILKKIQISNR
jgi:serine/threonine protein kinase